MAADPSLYAFPSPLADTDISETLGTELHADGPDAKAYINKPSNTRSPAYDTFVQPIDNGTRGGFDVHIYFMQADPEQHKFATELHERIRREFPEIRIYSVFDRPLGPHPIGMFEVNLHSPAQFGAFVPWLVINRGPLSALIHPNTNDEIRDHTQRATWMGDPIPLNISLLRKLLTKRDA
ncbi:hypothetical protein AMS68_001506 [Peltaster fructicola]|uniref:DOPA 4,5-dioxygenase n=1 Tax=Peltaster fructicola TaxID=286661 RepID=A0A6H0XMZ0_9PEZI|nr:hypothetical protein AMS68_001506 [Peltaster fructicola]